MGRRGFIVEMGKRRFERVFLEFFGWRVVGLVVFRGYLLILLKYSY